MVIDNFDWQGICRSWRGNGLVELISLAGVILLAFVNGANDNFKAVATVYGSGSLSYHGALILTTVTTAMGSLASLALGAGLIRAFSGKGLIPDAVLDSSTLTAVGLGAAITVLVATRFGLPISTTHALVGGLVGAGFVVAGPDLRISALGNAFLIPLALGPLLAVAIAWGALRAARAALRSPPPGGPMWARVGPKIEPRTAKLVHYEAYAIRALEDGSVAPEIPTEATIPISRTDALQVGHLISASAVGFARGLNDTPKILGIAMGATLLTPLEGTLLITAAMALGGIIAARRVAETLAHEITPLTSGQGFVGNLTTSLLVICASRVGLPVSTTHVSTGSIFGIGGADGRLEWSAVAWILAAWLTTLPLAIVISALVMWLQQQL
jgi:PiT family inorganic phosphate transporter